MPSRTLAWLVFFSLMGALALRINGQVHVAESDSIAREQATYDYLRRLIRDNYVREVDEKKLFYNAMNGMASGLDPHSQFFSPEHYEGLKTSTTGQFEGIGIEFHPDESLGLVVLAPILDTPAYRAGILPGDKILKINGVSTEGMSRDEASRRIKGAVSSAVVLTILHEGSKDSVEIPLVRAINEIRSVPIAELIAEPYVPAGGPKIGYAQVAQFQPKTAADLDSALRRLEAQGMQALVLDLRQNPGGLLEVAEQVADLFLKDGEIVRVITRAAAKAKSSGNITYAHVEGTHPDYPMAILIDGHSASASEVVSGALKDRGRAVLVGEKSYGKFSVQNIFKIPLEDWGESALKLTVARYQTPSSPCVDGEGLVPDFLVPLSAEQQKDLQNSRLLRHIKDNDPRNGKGEAHSSSAPQSSFVDPQMKKAVEVLLSRLQPVK